MKTQMNKTQMMRTLLIRCGTIMVVSALLSGCISLPGQSPIQSMAFDKMTDQEREALAQNYDRNPQNRNAALAYASSLRATGQHSQAVAVLEKLTIRYPEDREVLSVFGKSLIDVGRASQAAEVLGNAHTPDRPDWTILSAQGIAADQQNDHERARSFYQAALAIVPDETSVLTNLGLSYVLSGNLGEAENSLSTAAKRADATTTTRKNFAMVLALRGKTKEAQAALAQDMSPKDADQFIKQFKRRS